MADVLFTTKEEVTNSLAGFVEYEALKLHFEDEYTIENEGDKAVANPVYQPSLNLVNDPDDFDDDDQPLTLSLYENHLLSVGFSDEPQNFGEGFLGLFKRKFKKVKQKVRAAFCNIVKGLNADSSFNWKDIIKTVLIALIPAFAGGVPAIVLPVLISIIAIAMKSGISKACPV